MRTLERNKKKFYFATYNSKMENFDSDGMHTFEHTASYGAWTEYYANISPARGTSDAEMFGANIDYDRTIVTDDLSCPIDEQTVLAIDIEPNERQTATVAPVYDYVVTKKAVSLNFIQYAVRKVQVDV